MKFALGENPKQTNRTRPDGVTPRYPATRMGVELTLRTSFTRAQEYQAERRTYEAARARGEDPMPPRRDFRLEALAGILDGSILVHAHCYRSDEILMLLRVAEDFGFRIASLQHVLEGYKVADEIAAHGAGASTFADGWGYKMEAFDAIPYNAALMASRGVTASINSDAVGEMTSRLYLQAAKAMKYGGASEEEALKMITLNAAKHLRIDHRVGSRAAPRQETHTTPCSGPLPFSKRPASPSAFDRAARQMRATSPIMQGSRSPSGFLERAPGAP